MKAAKKTSVSGTVVIDATMDKNNSIIYFPKKLKHAIKVFETAKLPKVKIKK